METFQCDVVQVCPSPDDELAFAAYAITLHDHFIGGRGSAHLAGAKQCNISSVRAERVRYLARPDWERTAALYTNFAQAAAIGVAPLLAAWSTEAFAASSFVTTSV